MSYGFVYMARNESMPGLYKIGSTSYPPSLRMIQLSQSTSVPTPFILMAYCEMRGYKKFEAALHSDFSEFRHASNREFFRFLSGTMLEMDWLFSIYGDSYWVNSRDIEEQADYLRSIEDEVQS